MFALGLILGILATLGVLFVLGACKVAGEADEAASNQYWMRQIFEDAEEVCDEWKWN